MPTLYLRYLAQVALALLLCGCGGGRGRKPEVRIAITLGTFGHLPVYLAQSLGYFEQEGVHVSFATMAGSSKVMEAVVGGSADIAAASLEQSIQMAAEGRPVPAFVADFFGPPFALVVSPKASERIRRIEDLRGATIGISSPGSQTQFIANHLLATEGLPAGEVTPIGIGLSAGNIAAVEHGRVDAAITSASGLVMLKRRHPALTVLFDPLAREDFRRVFGVDRYPSHVLAAPLPWMQANPGTVRGLTRAVVRALRYIKEHPADELIGFLPKEYRMADASADTEALRGWTAMFPVDGVIPEDGYEAAKRVVGQSVEKVRTAAIDPRVVYTNEFVREAK